MSLIKNSIVLPLLFAVIIFNANGQSKHGNSSLYKSYKGLVMAGYQGWFRAEGDAVDNGWGHFGRNGKFDAENNTIDFWPDVSDYEKTYKTNFKYPDGRVAEVFSSVDKSTTKLHFKWMKDYGVDGVFMQRFFGVTRKYEKTNKPQDIILRNALEESIKNKRAIAVMYDLSGLKAEGEDCSSVIEDWKMLVDKLAMQLVLITHQEELKEIGDMVYEFTKENDRTIIKLESDRRG